MPTSRRRKQKTRKAAARPCRLTRRPTSRTKRNTPTTSSAPEAGGGFGGTHGLVAPLVGLVARRTGRPVKHIYTRHEELQASNPAPASRLWIKTGCKKDGTLTAIEAKVFVDTRAYSGSPM